MSTSQSSSSTQDGLNEKRVFCFFLERTYDENDKETFKVNKDINFMFPIPNEDSSAFDLMRIALSAIQKKYPGVEMINLYLPKSKYCKIKQIDSAQSYIRIDNQDIELSLNQLDELCNATFYFEITSIYGEEDFNTIKKVKCNFITPYGLRDSKWILMPDTPVQITAFQEAWSTFFKNKIQVQFINLSDSLINNTIEEINSNNLHDLKVSFNYIYDNVYLNSLLVKLISDDYEVLKKAFFDYLSHKIELKVVVGNVKPKFTKDKYKYKDKD